VRGRRHRITAYWSCPSSGRRSRRVGHGRALYLRARALQRRKLCRRRMRRMGRQSPRRLGRFYRPQKKINRGRCRHGVGRPRPRRRRCTRARGCSAGMGRGPRLFGGRRGRKGVHWGAVAGGLLAADGAAFGPLEPLQKPVVVVVLHLRVLPPRYTRALSLGPRPCCRSRRWQRGRQRPAAVAEARVVPRPQPSRCQPCTRRGLAGSAGVGRRSRQGASQARGLEKVA
jgi:hypothetical protein